MNGTRLATVPGKGFFSDSFGLLRTDQCCSDQKSWKPAILKNTVERLNLDKEKNYERIPATPIITAKHESPFSKSANDIPSTPARTVMTEESMSRRRSLGLRVGLAID